MEQIKVDKMADKDDLGIATFGRITSHPQNPSIRDTSITVAAVLDRLASGQTAVEIVAQHPDLREEDLMAVFGYAAYRVRSKTSIDETLGLIKQDIEEKLRTITGSRIPLRAELP